MVDGFPAVVMLEEGDPLSDVTGQQWLQLEERSQPQNTASNATKPVEEEERQAQEQAYLQRIRQFQRLNKQKWDPETEQTLAKDLVEVDNAMRVSPEEKEIERKLCRGHLPQEMSLRRIEEEKHQRKQKNQAEKDQQQLQKDAQKEKIQAFAREQKHIAEQIEKYRKLAIPPVLHKQWKAAKKQYLLAVKLETSKKQTPHFKAFKDEYMSKAPVEKQADYPRGIPKDHTSTPQKIRAELGFR